MRGYRDGCKSDCVFLVEATDRALKVETHRNAGAFFGHCGPAVTWVRLL